LKIRKESVAKQVRPRDPKAARNGARAATSFVPRPIIVIV
jgi:hypothetical protein